MSVPRGCACGCFAPLSIFTVALVLGFVCHAWLLTTLGSQLVRDDPPEKSDAVVALAGDDYGYRVLKAGELVRQGWAPYAVISGNPYLLTNEAQETIAFAVAKGYPRGYFRPFQRDMVSTRDETANLAAWLRSQDVHKILLVTSNYHTRRAGYLMSQAAPWLQIRTVAAPDKYFTPDGWWKLRGGQRTFLNEWLKTFYAHAGD